MKAKEYFELQEKIYNKLLEENKKNGLNFSVRRKFQKETLSNYFLGTLKSEYIGFSLWYIRLGYPGASIDLLTYIIREQKGEWRVFLQGHQTKAPQDEQNKTNLDLIQKLKTPFLKLEKKGKYTYWENKGDAKMYTSRIGLYTSKNLIIDELLNLINETKPLVDKLMKELKKTNTNWEARSINDEEFEKWQNKLKTKRIPYDIKNINPKIEKDEGGIETNIIENSINKILYGPPGTGKTYKLKTEYFPKYTSKEINLNSEKYFEKVVSELTWFETIALAILDNNAPITVPEIKETRWIKIKSNYSENKNINAGIWNQLQAHTIDKCELVKYQNRQSPQIFVKNRDKSWGISKEDFEDLTPELVDILEKTNNFQANPDKEIKRYEFVTFHQSYSYEDFIEGIKPVMDNDGELSYEIKDGLFKKLCQRAKNDSENKYAIFIDEINRGNVSSIFGELITLIEPDKRLGMENAMKTTLPYSRDSFGVPSNVDIYGTMNTADRSVEALDTALRRRFAFEEMLPKPEILKGSKDLKISLESLLTCINQRIEALIDRDHTIGHSYLINVKNMEDLKLVFKDKIIPLLQEYFYGDYGKIGLVLGGGFVKLLNQDNEIFADFEYDGSNGLAQNKFELVKLDENFDLEQALETLLKKTN